MSNSLQAVILDAEMTCRENLVLKHVTSPKVPPSIGKLKRLQRLEVISTDFGTAHTRWLRSQGQLNMSNVIVGSIPATIGQLKNLQQLILKGTYNLPEEIGDLEHLTELCLDCSVSSSVPSSIGRLKNLQNLVLDCCHLTELPEEIGNLTNLKSLKIPCTKIVSLPPTIGKLCNLEKLDLRGSSHLTSLPETIGDLISLTDLYLTHASSMTSFPISANKLSSLEVLSVSNIVPQADRKGPPLAEIGNFFHANLKTVDLRGSKLTSLPYSLGNLKGLRYLDLIRTRVRTRLPLIPFDFLRTLTERCPLLGWIELEKRALNAEEFERLDFALACNRARFRTGFGWKTERFAPSCWPKLLSNVSRSFSLDGTMRSYCPVFGRVVTLPSEEDVIFHLLTRGDGGKHFIEMLQSR